MCNDVPEEVCNSVPASVTKYVDEENCSNIGARKCSPVTRQECQDVVEQVPSQTSDTQCKTEYIDGATALGTERETGSNRLKTIYVGGRRYFICSRGK